MKNFIITVMFCFFGLLSFAQKRSGTPFKKEYLKLEKLSMPYNALAIAEKSEDVYDKNGEESIVSILNVNMERYDTPLRNVISSAELDDGKNRIFLNIGISQSKNIEIKLERNLIPSNIKATIESAE